MKKSKVPIFKGLLFGTLLTASLVVCTSVAHADLSSDTQSFSFNGSTTPYSLSLNSFNIALGTLTDISLTLVTNITPQVQLINFTSSSQNFTNAESTTPFTLTGPGSTVVNATASTGLINGTAVAPQYNISTFSGPTVQQTQTIDIASAIWNQYEGTGSLAFQAAIGPFTSSASFTPGTLAVGGNGSVNGDVTIDYTYTAVPTPIPAAVYLFGSGLLGLVGIRRKLN
ncbi:MAG: choice-of-anchor E domain-containing protein [Thermodesulfovibrionales bacterium]|jgi:hypothetical protein